MNTNQTEKTWAHGLGVSAFIGGKSSVPVHDPLLMKMIAANSGKPSSAENASVLELLTAWGKGWDQANLAAPVA